jgi:hypothetical protein
MSREIKPLPAVNVDDVEWEGTRFGTTFVKVLSFRDGVNFEICKYEPGARTFPHQHGFRQLRYVLKGEFVINGNTYGPNTLIDFPALTEYEVECPDGGELIILQMPDAGTGESPKDPTGKAYGAENATAA